MAQRKQYKARPNSPLKDKDAKVIGKFLDENFPDGEYTPEEVVKLAEDPKSPIHSYFEWDNTRAAHLYRLSQARRLITCVVEIVGGQEIPKAVNVYVEDQKHRVYMETEKAKEIPDIWDSVLREALRGASAWKRRFETFSQLKELKPVIEAIGNLEKQFEEKEKYGTQSSTTQTGSNEARSSS